ncbi:MAG: SagB/ThcOx family dehydrogenase [Candidatus Eisenbacteria bacterium]|nr:SagB/ThcOx family dehydrogenase [Candidatus Eisenbacteria bacterium]
MAKEKRRGGGRGRAIELPPPDFAGKCSLEAALEGRRSVREFKKGSLPLRVASQLLWAAQGVTGEAGDRTAPSAGGLFPLAVLLVAGEVEDLPTGTYRYDPESHTLSLHIEKDIRPELASASLGQEWIAVTPISMIFLADYDRTAERYGERGIRYVDMEVGHAAQNVHLQAAALGLGSVPVGAFHDRAVQELLELPDNEEPLYIIPVGRPK